MPIHIWFAWIGLGIAAVLGTVIAFVKWYVHITTERDVEKFHKEFSPLAAKKLSEKEKEQNNVFSAEEWDLLLKCTKRQLQEEEKEEKE